MWWLLIPAVGVAALVARKNARVKATEDRLANELETALGSLDPMRALHLADKFSGFGRFGAEQMLRSHAADLQRQGYGRGAPGTPNVMRTPARLSPGEVLQPQLDRQNKVIRGRGANLVFQTDGDLVLYGPSKQQLWTSGTSRSGVQSLAMQADGNLVIYGNGAPITYRGQSGYSRGSPLWSSGTAGNPGAWLEVRGGAAVVVGPRGNVLWSSQSGAAPTTGVPGVAGLPGTAGVPGLAGAPYRRGYYVPRRREHWDESWQARRVAPLVPLGYGEAPDLMPTTGPIASVPAPIDWKSNLPPQAGDAPPMMVDESPDDFPDPADASPMSTDDAGGLIPPPAPQQDDSDASS